MLLIYFLVEKSLKKIGKRIKRGIESIVIKNKQNKKYHDNNSYNKNKTYYDNSDFFEGSKNGKN